MKPSFSWSTAAFVFLIIISVASCTTRDAGPPVRDYFSMPESGIQDGGIRRIKIGTPKDSFFVWTKQVGNNPKLRVLLLSGGPGCSHEYFECFENFFPRNDIEFIYYDQLGCGFSDNPNDTAMWDLSRYVDELEQVRMALKLDSTNCVLLGHSWGGILAMEYAITQHDEQLSRLRQICR
jgi:proline iminopeptidase